MIECVTIENMHHYSANLIAGQHKLRFETNIIRQNWEIPTVRAMEYDQYDNPAAYYFVKRDEKGEIVGCLRLYPTDRPYMLQEFFPHLVTKIDMPSSNKVWEGSRFCISKKLSAQQRKRLSQELVLSYLEFGIDNDIKSIVGLMFPVYWKNLFVKNGWDVKWLGDVHRSAEGHKIVAGDLRVSKEVLENVRQVTGINYPVLRYGDQKFNNIKAA